MTSRTTTLARVGATAVLATGVLAGLTTPAFAEPTPTAAASPEADLALALTGLTVADNAAGKYSSVKVTNHSKTNTAKGVGLVFALGKLDRTKVEFQGPNQGCKEVASIPGDDGEPPVTEDGPFLICLAPDIKPGGTPTYFFRLIQKPGAAPGPAGVLEAAVIHDGDDPNEGNNEATKPAIIGASGADLVIVAPDVYAVPPKDKPGEQKPVQPGQSTLLLAYVENQGDKAISGLNFSLALPNGVTFAQADPNCVFSADKRTGTCSLKQAALLPTSEDKDKNSETDGVSGGWFFWPVTVGKDVKGPVTLTNGVVGAQGIKEVAVTPSVQRAPSAEAFPDNFSLAAPAEAAVPAAADVDPTDNADDFSVLVAAAAVVTPPSASPSPSPSASATAPPASGSGGGNPLPVTGAQAGLLGGTGLAVLLVGGVLFFLARRRRVVLVTPDDEKSPTA